MLPSGLSHHHLSLSLLLTFRLFFKKKQTKKLLGVFFLHMSRFSPLTTSSPPPKAILNTVAEVAILNYVRLYHLLAQNLPMVFHLKILNLACMAVLAHPLVYDHIFFISHGHFTFLFLKYTWHNSCTWPWPLLLLFSTMLFSQLPAGLLPLFLLGISLNIPLKMWPSLVILYKMVSSHHYHHHINSLNFLLCFIFLLSTSPTCILWFFFHTLSLKWKLCGGAGTCLFCSQSHPIAWCSPHQCIIC